MLLASTRHTLPNVTLYTAWRFTLHKTARNIWRGQQHPLLELLSLCPTSSALSLFSFSQTLSLFSAQNSLVYISLHHTRSNRNQYCIYRIIIFSVVRNSVYFQINRKIVNTVRFWLESTRFGNHSQWAVSLSPFQTQSNTFLIIPFINRKEYELNDRFPSDCEPRTEFCLFYSQYDHFPFVLEGIGNAFLGVHG